ncbi:uncharacterized protein LOC105355766 [Oryzias latipes]|uniref:uncharacterized protein LOC105355766 n=1 Tax=Oryzias latipes TaxID=8090 RepID=UPI0005CC78B8|nr:uncharacterized protein LOC105355766 [Oryzias latipes]XP_023819162.1 uncharacterized protein LOC105355766 [Oryzias latipes]
MMRKYFFLLLFGWFLVRCQSGIPCNVTQTPKGTLYLLNITAPDWIYNWSNKSTVLSTNKKKMDGVVLDSSFNSLLTIPCYEEVKYLCLCKSKNEPTTATCKTSCPVSSPRNGGEESDRSEIHHPALSGSETSPNHIVVPVTVFFLLIVAVVFLVV